MSKFSPASSHSYQVSGIASRDANDLETFMAWELNLVACEPRLLSRSVRHRPDFCSCFEILGRVKGLRCSISVRRTRLGGMTLGA